jgi:membrane protein
MNSDRNIEGLRKLPYLFEESMKELLKNDPLRMAGATAFFTTFALPPILVILIQIFRLIIDPVIVRTKLFESLSGIVGPETVEQITGVLGALRKLAQNGYVTIVGFIFLLFVATTLFKIIKNSINQVWKIRPLQKQGIGKMVRTRVQSVFVIILAGILFMIGLVAETIQATIGNYIFEFSPILSFYFNTAISHIVSIIIVTVWFAMVFRFLPDGRPSWRIAFTGGFMTAILFTVGKLVLHWLLTYSNINTLYGASASIVLLLLFVFYSSLILYYGAAFTKVLAIFKGRPIMPLPHAMHYKVVEEEV